MVEWVARFRMSDDIYYGDEYPDMSDIDEDMLRAYLEGKEVSPEIEELLKGLLSKDALIHFLIHKP